MVGDGITGTAVQQTVVSAGGAGRKIETFYQKHAQPSLRTVACGAGSSGASADDYYVVVFFLKFRFHYNAMMW